MFALGVDVKHDRAFHTSRDYRSRAHRWLAGNDPPPEGNGHQGHRGGAAR